MTSLTHKRPQAIQAKFTPAEKALIQEAAEYAGIPMATIMRMAAVAWANQLLATPARDLPRQLVPQNFKPSEFKVVGQ